MAAKTAPKTQKKTPKKATTRKRKTSAAKDAPRQTFEGLTVQAEVQAYIQGVMDGSIVTGKWVRRAVERHVYDLIHGPERGLYFDADAGQLVIDFFGLLQHSKGEWAGQTFKLDPWQKFVVWVMFGWKRADGTRRFRTAYIEICRKNGKSTLAAGIGLFLLVADGEAGAEIYAAATKRDQAKILFTEAERMVKASPTLKRRIRNVRNNLNVPLTNSKFEPLGADVDGMDGLNPHGVIIDELHAHKTRAVYDVLDSATGARRQPLVFTITTAGAGRKGVCWDERQHSTQILDGFDRPGGLQSDAHFCFIAAIDDEDDWKDERNWIKANPNLGVSVKIDDLRRKADKAKVMPTARNEFLRKHLNRWTDTHTLWLPMEKWDDTDPGVDPLEWRAEKMTELANRRCVSALDLGATGDLAVLTLLFDRDDGGYDWLPFFWVPEDSSAVRERADRVPYQLWIEQGLIIPTEGDVTDFDQVENDIDDLASQFGLQELAIDRLFQGEQMLQNLRNKRGLNAFAFGQGMYSMAAPTKRFGELVMAKKMHHGNHPILRWMATNTVVETDAAGNIKPTKAKSTGRIDGIVTGVMAVGRAGVQEPYEELGVWGI